MRGVSLFEEYRSSWSVHTATDGNARQDAATGRVSSIVSAENVATKDKLVGYFVIKCFSLFSQYFSPNMMQIGFCTLLANPFVFTVWKTSGLAPQRKLVKFVNGYKYVGEVSQIFRRCLGTSCLQIILYILIYLPVWLDLHSVCERCQCTCFPQRIHYNLQVSIAKGGVSKVSICAGFLACKTCPSSRCRWPDRLKVLYRPRHCRGLSCDDFVPANGRSGLVRRRCLDDWDNK